MLISNGIIIQWVSAMNATTTELLYPIALNKVLSIAYCYIPYTTSSYEYRVAVCETVTNTMCSYWFHNGSSGDIWFLIVGY